LRVTGFEREDLSRIEQRRVPEQKTESIVREEMRVMPGKTKLVARFSED